MYFHIPFCKKKCPYCHFYVIPDRPQFQQILSESLRLEWALRAPLLLGKKIRSIYFGGGTPTLFAPQGILQILSLLKETGINSLSHLEVTIEANPEDANPALFEALLEAGVNRISFGVQSLDDRSLSLLGREHGAKKAKDAVLMAHRSGFQNISIDLMYDLPDQTEASWLYTLNQIPDLPIQHVSLYNLTIEPHTSFYRRKNTLHLPDEKASLGFLHAAIDAFEKQGLIRYEISAFARLGFESKHNKGYWIGRPFLGFGPSAFSYWEGSRFRNIANLQRYARALRTGALPIDFSETLPHPKNLQELLAVRLRLSEGVDCQEYPGLSASSFSILEKWKNLGCLIQENSCFRLTDRGMLLYDEIASDLV